jgi:hypothetical protein
MIQLKGAGPSQRRESKGTRFIHDRLTYSLCQSNNPLYSLFFILTFVSSVMTLTRTLKGKLCINYGALGLKPTNILFSGQISQLIVISREMNFIG